VSTPNTLLGIVDLLRWEGDTVNINGLCERFDDHIDCLFNAKEFAEAAGRSVFSGIKMLPDRERQKFLRAPQVVSQLIKWRRHRLGLDLRYLSELVLAELAQSGIIKDLPVRVWSSRGDIQLPTVERDEDNQATPWLIDGEIAIDDKSPQMFPYDGTAQKLLLLLDDEDSARVRQMLAAALEVLSKALRPTFHLVKSFLRQISIRLEPGAPTIFNSSSFSQYVGLALLINPHLKGVDVPNLTEALVHESIHSMLFMIEELEEPFLLDRASARILVRSPWSGNIINLNAYLHACLVWYGLFWLWTRLIETKALPEHRCTVFRERARSGFAHRQLSSISQHLPLLSRRIIGVVETVEATMQQHGCH